MARRPRFLKIVLEGEVAEKSSDSFFASRPKVFLPGLLELLRSATLHKSLQVVVVVVRQTTLAWSQVEEIHEQLEALRRAGKKSWIFLEIADNLTYYLACGFDRIFLPPSSSLELIGLRAETVFFRDFLQTWGVKPELITVGDFKSAGEIFTRTDMSEPNREMVRAILSDLNSRLIAKIGEGRRVDQLSAVEEWIARGPYGAEAAAEQGLVDELAYEDQLVEKLTHDFPKIKKVAPHKVFRRDGWMKRALTFRRPKIAYVVIEGLIHQGDSREQFGRFPVTGSDTLRQILEQIRSDSRIKAVVLRVNSPGGAALASDLIWRELVLTSEKKPIVVSMGSQAASGGYYVALAGATVLAMPSTLTGSIGVIGGKFNLAGLLEKLRITTDSVSMSANAGYRSASRGFSETELAAVAALTNETYRLFIERVCEGRDLERDKVLEIAAGRVWTGNQALPLGLLDRFGGLLEAIAEARSLAGLDGKRYRLSHISARKSWRDRLPLPRLAALSTTRVWSLGPIELKVE